MSQESLPTEPVVLEGCGDHSCQFARPKGMGTNGGCRCLKDIRTPERYRVQRWIGIYQRALREIEEGGLNGHEYVEIARKALKGIV